MPTEISTSLTTGDTRTYVYPEDTAYVVKIENNEVLYSMELAPREQGQPE